MTTWNSAFPRFGFGGLVPGSGDGDTVPAFVPQGAFVMNRNGTSALQGRGYQSGGTVSGQVVTRHEKTEIHFHGNITVRSDEDIRRLAKEIGDEIDRRNARKSRNSFNP